ncbi:hypothetical protein [Burkholderia sp. ISTR5]|uniref:hypothetical protein n=1 Tax=Burkholderia sp. ISTR5 TaxID=2500161 RepID=UPI00136CB6BF|nr:hypothetical protein [Burkholderia sp. ISTR5]NBI48186.1 hypothetical protein [Burkholderia sp. ISTR5]
MNMIRRMNIETGAPATAADEAAGRAHFVECDHMGNIIRDENRAVTSYAGPEVRVTGAGSDDGLNSNRFVALAARMGDPRNSTQTISVCPSSLDIDPDAQAALQAQFEARFGSAAVRKSGGHL